MGKRETATVPPFSTIESSLSCLASATLSPSLPLPAPGPSLYLARRVPLARSRVLRPPERSRSIRWTVPDFSPRRERATVGTSRSDSQPESRGPRRVHGVIVCRHSANKYRLNLWYRNRDPTTSSQTCRQTRLKDKTCLKRYENLASSRTRRVIDIDLEDKNRPKRRDVFHFSGKAVRPTIHCFRAEYCFR
jgi:hypothetical protein